VGCHTAARTVHASPRPHAASAYLHANSLTIFHMGRAGIFLAAAVRCVLRLLLLHASLDVQVVYTYVSTCPTYIIRRPSKRGFDCPRDKGRSAPHSSHAGISVLTDGWREGFREGNQSARIMFHQGDPRGLCVRLSYCAGGGDSVCL